MFAMRWGTLPVFLIAAMTTGICKESSEVRHDGYRPPVDATGVGTIVVGDQDGDRVIEKQLHLGRVPTTGKTYFVEIVNRSGRQLRARSIKSSCGCLVAAPRPAVFDDGQSMRLYIEMKSTQNGSFRRPIQVIFAGSGEGSDADTLPCILTCIGECLHPVRINPPVIDVGQEDRPVEMTLTGNFGDFDPKKQEVQIPSSGDANVMAKRLSVSGDTAKFQLWFQGLDWPAGDLEKTFCVRVRGYGKDLEHPLRVRNRAAVRLRPRYIVVSKDRDARPPMLYLSVPAADSIESYRSLLGEAQHPDKDKGWIQFEMVIDRFVREFDIAAVRIVPPYELLESTDATTFDCRLRWQGEDEPVEKMKMVVRF
ncbi:hypothetical protein Pan14r_25310 [Crateriforma conspicua]|uniref:DUF1573 domain-containing protein n=1 Tax=Crateriforma conspicua TaxID=2527996 RepID=A0A5C5Y4P8_9PLAN|nr:hypothetical protein Pan14r_25310 [Crateriforma conspicua]